jgi:hypothetical protein
MASTINNNKVAFFLLVLVLIGLLAVLIFSALPHGIGLEFVDTFTLRYCASSGGVCTGV